jgi:hypothetical protein
VAEIANSLWAAKKWNPSKGEECEYDNNLWYVETGDERNCARGLSELDAKEIVEAHNSAVTRAVEEAHTAGWDAALSLIKQSILEQEEIIDEAIKEMKETK